MYEYTKSQSDATGEQEQVRKELRKIDKKISNIVNAISGGFDAEELKAEYTALKTRKTTLQTELATLEDKATNKLSFEEKDVLQALRNLRDMVNYPRDEDNLKQVYARFIDCTEVHEGYVTIPLNILIILGYRRNVYPLMNEKDHHLTFIKWWSGMVEPRGSEQLFATS